MLGNDVLDQFDERRRFWRRIINAVAIGLNICLLAGFVVAISLIMGGTPFNFETQTAQMPTSSQPSSVSPQAAETVPEIAPLGNMQTLAPLFQTTPLVPIIPETKNSNQASTTNVPRPVARPRQVIGQTSKTAKPEGSNNTKKSDESNNKNKSNLANPHSPNNEAQEAKQQSDANEPIPADLNTRKTVAINLERTYSAAGAEILTSVSGSNGTVLNLKYAQFDDALVQKIRGVQSFTTILQEVGFAKVVFTDGHGKTWEFPLQPSSQSNTATQGPTSDKN